MEEEAGVEVGRGKRNKMNGCRERESNSHEVALTSF